jgi:hypothetical protein
MLRPTMDTLLDDDVGAPIASLVPQEKKDLVAFLWAL